MPPPQPTLKDEMGRSVPSRLVKARSGDVGRIPTDLGVEDFFPVLAAARLKEGKYDFRRNTQAVRELEDDEIIALLRVYTVAWMALQDETEKVFTLDVLNKRLTEYKFREAPGYHALMTRLINEIRRLSTTTDSTVVYDQ